MITNGTRDLQHSTISCVISPMGVERLNRIVGASQKVSLVDMMDSMSWSVAMLSMGLPITQSE